MRAVSGRTFEGLWREMMKCQLPQLDKRGAYLAGANGWAVSVRGGFLLVLRVRPVLRAQVARPPLCGVFTEPTPCPVLRGVLQRGERGLVVSCIAEFCCHAVRVRRRNVDPELNREYRRIVFLASGAGAAAILKTATAT